MGCASHVQHVYVGAERRVTETATIYTSRRAFVSSIVSVLSVDDQRVQETATGYSVLPGAHVYQVWVDRLSTGSLFLLHDAYYTEAVCGFTLDAAPGSAYQLLDVDNGSVTPEKEGGMYEATVEIRSDSVLARVPAECAGVDLFEHGLLEIPHDLSKGGLLCRSSSDCAKAEAACVIDAGHAFGICR